MLLKRGCVGHDIVEVLRGEQGLMVESVEGCYIVMKAQQKGPRGSQSTGYMLKGVRAHEAKRLGSGLRW